MSLKCTSAAPGCHQYDLAPHLRLQHLVRHVCEQRRKSAIALQHLDDINLILGHVFSPMVEIWQTASIQRGVAVARVERLPTTTPILRRYMEVTLEGS
jgi:hypothetical protein